MEGAPSAFAIRDARKVDARGIEEHAWIVADANGAIAARGTSDDDFEAACRANGIGTDAVIDASGKIMTPGYVDIHSHGAWEKSLTTARMASMWRAPGMRCMARPVRCVR